MLTRLGEVTFQVPQVRFGDFYIAPWKTNSCLRVVSTILAELDTK
jgi:hypothetical protein